MGGHGFKPGDVFAGYEVVRRLGEGGAGEVYLVRHAQLNKQFALKVLIPHKANNPEFEARFTREMRTVSALDGHSNIVASTNAGVTGDRPWLVMEFIDGRDAVTVLSAESSGLPVADVVHIAQSVGSALDYAHGQGFIHRDVKPGNILIRNDGHVFLTDFGIARAIIDPDPITTDGIPATWAYASPEQLNGQQLGGRSDQYSLAATVHTLLTGRTPFQNALAARAANDPPRPSHVNARLPPAVDAVVGRAMATDPSKRFADCASFALALQEAATSSGREDPGQDTLRSMPGVSSVRTIAATQLEPLPPDRPNPTRPRWPLFIGGVAALVVAAAGTGIVLAGPDSGMASSNPAATSSADTGLPAVSGGRSVTAAAASPAAVSPLADVLEPPLPTSSGRSADQPIAGAPTINLGPRNCANGVEQLTVDVGSGLERITGTFLMSDDADSTTHTQVTVIADGARGEPQTITPRSGVTIDSRVSGAGAVVIELATAGSGSCGSDDYEVFLTNSQAFR